MKIIEIFSMKQRDGLGLKKESGFHCSITGCSYKGSKHRDYLKHLKSTHFTHKSLLCNFTEQLVICDDNLFTEIEDPMDTEDGAIEIIVTERSEDDSDQDFEDESEFSPVESVHGLRSKCPLNRLQAFHAVNSFPQDSLHDVLEGSNFKAKFLDGPKVNFFF